MGEDCWVIKGNDYFRYRAGGIIIHDNKMLFVQSKFGDNYYYMIGGCVHIGETSKSCVEREVYEEAGIRVHAERLAVLCENFFKGHGGSLEGLDCHTIEMYYLMAVDDMTEFRNITDDGEELVWIPLEDVKNSYVKPSFIPERFDEIISKKEIIQIIEERDRG